MCCHLVASYLNNQCLCCIFLKNLWSFLWYRHLRLFVGKRQFQKVWVDSWGMALSRKGASEVSLEPTSLLSKYTASNFNTHASSGQSVNTWKGEKGWWRLGFSNPEPLLAVTITLMIQELGFEAGRPESEIWLCHTVGLQIQMDYLISWDLTVLWK